MSRPVSLPRMTYAQYLNLERASEVKHGYLRGEIRAMAGGSPEHARLAANVIGEIGAALRGRPCGVFTSDARVRIEATDRATYPDVRVVCGRLEPAPEDPDAITNPMVIVEVPSDATEADDRGEKFAGYGRRDDRGVVDEAGAGETLRLTSIDVALSVDEVCRDPLAVGGL